MSGRVTLLDDPLDCAWLRETHLRHVPNLPPFESFELVGNEDSPEAVTLHSCRFPTILDQPVSQYRQDAKGTLKLLQRL